MKKIRRMIETDLLLGAQEKFCSKAKAQRWLDTPDDLFGGLTPRKMVDEAGGFRALEEVFYHS